jgi:hypothetical protein
MTLAKRLVCLIFVLVLATGTALAQGVATADLRGTITDPQGAVVSNATVTIRDKARNFERSATTDSDGEYLMLAVPPGEYEVTVVAQGFARMVTSGVNLTVGQAADLSIQVRIAGAEQTVEVQGTPELVETQRSSAATTIGQTRIDNLPINGRNYIFFTLTNSQVARDTAPAIGVAPTSALNIGGQRARSNLVNVDGADAVDNSTNGIRSTVSQEAVQEFQIITNGYAAEYGRALGGVVNIITRSGTNELHGNLFGYLRHRSIQADNPFTTVPDPAFTRVQAGATLGGPIKKDKTFFFFSYETTRRQETGFTTIGANNFDLIDASATFGAPAGTFLLTSQQIAFLTNPANAGLAALFPTYLGAAGLASATALNGVWPAALSGPLTPFSAFPTSCNPGAALLTSCPVPLPGSNFLPGDYVPLNSLIGNYPISEGTSVVALRLDHQFNASQRGLLRVNVSPSTVTGIQVNGQNQVFGQNAFSRTSQQTFRDVNVTAQHTWTIGNNKINEFRFQFARRGLLYTFSPEGDSSPSPPSGVGDFGTNADGGQVAINIPGYGFFGREPFSFADRRELRYQFTDQFSVIKGNHTFKFGGDINHLPVVADFTVNFGALFNFGSLSSASVLGAFNPLFGLFPAFSPVQAYGLGIPQTYVQQVGDPHFDTSNTALGFFAQDSWRIKPNLTLNFGVRYDVELTPSEAALNSLSDAAQVALNITQGIPRDTNNIAPRIGLAWDPFKDGKTVVRASYGLFYDHPLIGQAFLSQVSDGTQAPGIILFGGAPSNVSIAANPLALNATNIFQGILNTTGAAGAFGYVPTEMRFDPFTANSVFTNQNYLDPATATPLLLQPFGFPISADFEYAYSQQASFGVERDLGGNYSLAVTYNYSGARHINRPINVNTTDPEALVVNWERAVAAATLAGIPQTSPSFPSTPLSVALCPALLGGLAPLGNYAPAALLSFFRPGGINPSLAQPPAPAVPFLACGGAAATAATEFGLGLGVPIPFSDMTANISSGSSVYHGMTVNLKKRFSRKYEFLASYTWAHAIDDSTDLQSLLAPQINQRPELERANSSFDQRHRFVLSGVYQSGRVGGDGFWSKFASDWTFAPIIEISSGRPFNILVGGDRNFDFGPNTDRPRIVAPGTTNLCGDTAVPSEFSPMGAFIPACFNDGVIDGIAGNPVAGDLGRNAGIRPYTVFTDMRVARRFHFNDRWKLDVVADMFNVINRFNVADVNVLFSAAGTPTAAFDPRQVQFALKLSW